MGYGCWILNKITLFGKVLTNVYTVLLLSNQRDMDFEWDEVKNHKNIKKHGVSFDEARHIFENIYISGFDTRRDYGEVREIGIGRVEEMVFVVVHATRRSKTRIISARFANRKERRKYYEHIKK